MVTKLAGDEDVVSVTFSPLKNLLAIGLTRGSTTTIQLWDVQLRQWEPKTETGDRAELVG